MPSLYRLVGLMGVLVTGFCYAGQTSLADQLHWQAQPNRCGGHFVNQFKAPKTPIIGYRIAAKHMTVTKAQQHARGGVKIHWQDGQVSTDHVDVRQSSRQQQQLWLPKGFTWDGLRSRLIVRRGQLHTSAHQGVLHDIIYRYSLPKYRAIWGRAQQLTIRDKQHWHLKKSSWSVCAPHQQLWHVRANDIWIDQQKGLGRFRAGTLYIKNLPVFYWPRLTFPIDKARHTGFLKPEMTDTDYQGWGLNWPWYWNVKPWHDWLIRPNYTSQNGFALGWLGRYLTRWGQVNFSGFVVPKDSAFNAFKTTTLARYAGDPMRGTGLADLNRAKSQRWGLAFNQSWQHGRQSLQTRFEAASDNDFTRQWPGVMKVAHPQFLNQGLEWRYEGDHWQMHFGGWQWQTLHSILWKPVANPYAATPHLHGFFYHALSGHWFADAHLDAGYFRQKPLSGLVNLPYGSRVSARPTLHWRYANHWGQWQTHFGLHMVSQDLTQSTTSAHINKTIPWLSAEWQNGAWLTGHAQPLRLMFHAFYAWVPYRDQNRLAHFDLNWRSSVGLPLFHVNRFTGEDWIGDTHHVAFGVRLMQPSGLRHGAWQIDVAQGWAFKHHRVCLDAACVADVWARQHASPLQLVGKYFLNKHDMISSKLALNWQGHDVVTGYIEGQHTWQKQTILLSFNRIDVPKDDTLIDRIWWQNSHFPQMHAAWRKQWSSHWSSKIEASWDLNHRQLSDSRFSFKWQGCCAAMTAGVKRAYLLSDSIRHNRYDQQFFLKISVDS